MIILFLGRSVDGILADARREFPEEPFLVVSRDNDTLPPPAGLETVQVSQFRPLVGTSYTVIANGGTSAQLVQVLKNLVRSGVSMKVFDLQRDGMVQIW